MKFRNVSEATKRTMKKCQSGNALERSFWSALSSAGLSGWKRNDESLPGAPDASFPRLRLAVFVHGCFWHGCPRHHKPPKRNARFWREKIEANKRRDARTVRRLRAAGWRVLTVWEHEARKDGWGRVVSAARSGRDG